jgi:predicted ATPase
MRRAGDPPFIKWVGLRREWVESFDVHPYSVPAIRHLHSLELHNDVTFFVGENGSGKSTLLEAIAIAEGFNPEGGTPNFTFQTTIAHSDLYKTIMLGRGARRIARSDRFFLRAESFFNLATEVDRLGFDPMKNPYGPISLHAQSHGESFLTLFTRRFSGNGLYILDEPEAALSPQAQLTFLAALHELVERGSQFIIATHSPIIMAYPRSRLYVFSTDGIRETAYEETEHYRVTKAFLLRREKMLAELFDEPPPKSAE